MRRRGRFPLLLMLLPVAYLVVTILFGGRVLYLVDGG